MSDQSAQAATIRLVIKGIISELSGEDVRKVEAAAAELRAVLLKYGDVSQLAYALVGAEQV